MIFFVSFVNISHKKKFLPPPSPSFLKAFLKFCVIGPSIAVQAVSRSDDGTTIIIDFFSF